MEGPHARGSVGAGTGATVGKMLRHEGWCKGGLGGAGVVTADGCTVAAMAVANCYGDVLARDGGILSGCWMPGEGMAGTAARMLTDPPPDARLAATGNTTLCVVVTDAALDPAGAASVARMASSGLARAVSPVGTRVDGDVVICLATGRRPGNVMICGVAGAEAAAEAVRDAVRTATAVRGVPTAADRRARLDARGLGADPEDRVEPAGVVEGLDVVVPPQRAIVDDDLRDRASPRQLDEPHAGLAVPEREVDLLVLDALGVEEPLRPDAERAGV